MKNLTLEDITYYHHIFNAGLTLYDLKKRCLIDSIGFAEKVTGHSTETLSTPGIYDELIFPKDRTDFERFHSECEKLRDGEVIKYNFRFRTKDRADDWFHVKGMVFERHPATGEPKTLITSAINITDKVNFAKSLQVKMAQLETISQISANEIRTQVASILSLFKLLSSQSFHAKQDLEVFRHLEKTVEQLDLIVEKLRNEPKSE